MRPEAPPVPPLTFKQGCASVLVLLGLTGACALGLGVVWLVLVLFFSL